MLIYVFAIDKDLYSCASHKQMGPLPNSDHDLDDTGRRPSCVVILVTEASSPYDRVDGVSHVLLSFFARTLSIKRCTSSVWLGWALKAEPLISIKTRLSHGGGVKPSEV